MAKVLKNGKEIETRAEKFRRLARLDVPLPRRQAIRQARVDLNNAESIAKKAVIDEASSVEADKRVVKSLKDLGRAYGD